MESFSSLGMIPAMTNDTMEADIAAQAETQQIQAEAPVEPDQEKLQRSQMTSQAIRDLLIKMRCGIHPRFDLEPVGKDGSGKALLTTTFSVVAY